MSNPRSLACCGALCGHDGGGKPQESAGGVKGPVARELAPLQLESKIGSSSAEEKENSGSGTTCMRSRAKHLSYATNISYSVLASGNEKVAVGVAAMEELSNTATLSIQICRVVTSFALPVVSRLPDSTRNPQQKRHKPEVITRPQQQYLDFVLRCCCSRHHRQRVYAVLFGLQEPLPPHTSCCQQRASGVATSSAEV
jgi:hypothetical protein